MGASNSTLINNNTTNTTNITNSLETKVKQYCNANDANTNSVTIKNVTCNQCSSCDIGQINQNTVSIANASCVQSMNLSNIIDNDLVNFITNNVTVKDTDKVFQFNNSDSVNTVNNNINNITNTNNVNQYQSCLANKLNSNNNVIENVVINCGISSYNALGNPIYGTANVGNITSSIYSTIDQQCQQQSQLNFSNTNSVTNTTSNTTTYTYTNLIDSISSLFSSLLAALYTAVAGPFIIFILLVIIVPAIISVVSGSRNNNVSENSTGNNNSTQIKQEQSYGRKLRKAFSFGSSSGSAGSGSGPLIILIIMTVVNTILMNYMISRFNTNNGPEILGQYNALKPYSYYVYLANSSNNLPTAINNPIDVNASGYQKPTDYNSMINKTYGSYTFYDTNYYNKLSAYSNNITILGQFFYAYISLMSIFLIVIASTKNNSTVYTVFTIFAFLLSIIAVILLIVTANSVVPINSPTTDIGSFVNASSSSMTPGSYNPIVQVNNSQFLFRFVVNINKPAQTLSLVRNPNIQQNKQNSILVNASTKQALDAFPSKLVNNKVSPNYQLVVN
jgi:hypothetical protein